MRLNNLKLHDFLISILGFLFLNTCTLIAGDDLDQYLTQQAIGTWKSNEGFLHTETTYFADGTLKEREL